MYDSECSAFFFVLKNMEHNFMTSVEGATSDNEENCKTLVGEKWTIPLCECVLGGGGSHFLQPSLIPTPHPFFSTFNYGQKNLVLVALQR